MANKKKKCGYSIGVMYDEINNAIRNVEIMADGLVTGLPGISKARDLDGLYSDKITISLDNLLKVINIADLNTLFSLRISIYKDVSITEKQVLKEFSFSVMEPLYRDSFNCEEGFKLTKEGINKIYNEIYSSIIRKGGNEYLIEKFDNVLRRATKYIHNMKSKDIINPDIFIAIECNYDDYIIYNKFNSNKHYRNTRLYRLESFVKRYIIG